MVNIATWVLEQTQMEELVLERCSHFVKPSLLCTLTISMAGSGSIDMNDYINDMNDIVV
jgi:hypothetical protein